MTATETTAKWTAQDLGPRQAKMFNEALSTFGWEAKTVGEITDHGTFYSTPMFGGSWTETAKNIMDGIRTKYNLVVTGDNYKAIIAELEAAIPVLHANRHMIDKRSTPEERAERDRARQEREDKAKAEAERIAKFITHNYDVVEAAAALKQVLSVIWPTVKFSVKSEKYSGGYSITPSWTDGPTGQQVSKITDWFSNKHFDGMNDLETETDPSEWNGHRFNIRGGYVHGSRNTSAALLRACAFRFAGETGLEEPTIHDDGRYAYVERAGSPCGWSLYVHDTEHPEGVLSHDQAQINHWTAADLVGQMSHHFTDVEPAYPLNRDTVFRILLGEIKPTSAPVSPDFGHTARRVTVSQNEERDGVELRFPTKPDSAVLDRLKAHGWRWSKFSKCWCAKRTPTSLAFAEGIADGN